ncbi:MAG: hypothetical protein HOO67_04390 [Candidatus Peribacteraceae bacterium]|nr:hypothetical protein [Candidatus Peribacteraceae bacterium]
MPTSCRQCRRPFEISKSDQNFYDQVSPVIGKKKCPIPPPTLCPDCRMQRRYAFRNERHLYHRKCDKTGKQIISNLSPEKPCTVYMNDVWWSDQWDARTYGREFDFSRPFFEQFAELRAEVPRISLFQWFSENSEYCNYAGHVKDCYLIFGSVYAENCYYGSPYYSKNCVDTLVVRDCERCYECVDSRKLYECIGCRDCHNGRNLLFCYDCQSCQDCIGCAGLRQKQHCILNKQYSKQEYQKLRAQFDLSDPKTHTSLREKLRKISLEIPHRYMQSAQAQNVSGNYVYNCKNVLDSYYADRSEDCRHCAQVVDLKDCHDINFTEENELCYEYIGAYQNGRTLFSLFSNQLHGGIYCDACYTSKNLFGCCGIRNGEYCILNKQYSKEEYEKLVPKVIEHMKKTGEWGEFFPGTLSPFGYNETVAQEYFPLSEKDVIKKGWHWHNEQESKEQYMGPAAEIPRKIEDVTDDICQKILLCEVTGRPYKIIPQELSFYKDMGIPIPRVCPDERHKERMALRNPRKLWKRSCQKCQKEIMTTYAPDRPEIVYCDECYLSTVY